MHGMAAAIFVALVRFDLKGRSFRRADHAGKELAFRPWGCVPSAAEAGLRQILLRHG